MIATRRLPCPECGHGNQPVALSCDLCGVVLARRESPLPIVEVRSVRRAPLGGRWIALALGALLAPLFTFTPLLEYMGWFLGSVCHEGGHCLFAWLAGCPAFPAISLAGHAMARHSDQSLLLCFAIWTALGALAWSRRDDRRAFLLLAAATLLYPLYAFTGLREFFFLLGGHLGEVAIATVFFGRALAGGFTNSRAERVAYATVAFFLAGRNLWLAGGLLFDRSVQAWYAASGSFGLTNDLIRIHRWLGTSMGPVAFLLALLALAPLPAALLLGRSER